MEPDRYSESSSPIRSAPLTTDSRQIYRQPAIGYRIRSLPAVNHEERADLIGNWCLSFPARLCPPSVSLGARRLSAVKLTASLITRTDEEGVALLDRLALLLPVSLSMNWRWLFFNLVQSFYKVAPSRTN